MEGWEEASGIEEEGIGGLFVSFFEVGVFSLGFGFGFWIEF